MPQISVLARCHQLAFKLLKFKSSKLSARQHGQNPLEQSDAACKAGALVAVVDQVAEGHLAS
jgi:hypothetical protein